MNAWQRHSSGRFRVAALVCAIALLGWTHDLTSATAVSAASCADGWLQMPTTASMVASPGGVASLAGQPAWWVGRSSSQTPEILGWINGAWSQVTAPSARDAGFTAVSAAGSMSAWAVGYRRGLAPLPISARWDGTAWTEVKVPKLVGQASLSGVVALPDGTAWAVGAQLRKGRLHPLSLHWDGSQWVNASPALSSSQESGLTAVTTSADGHTWATGWRSMNGVAAPWIGMWDGAAWQSSSLPDVNGLGYLSDLQFHSSTEGWAAGYVQEPSGTYAPLLFQWDGQAWAAAASPWGSGSSVLLTAVSVSDDDTLVVAGDQMGNIGPEAVMATMRDGSWEVSPAPSDPFPGSWVNDAAPVDNGALVNVARSIRRQTNFANVYTSCEGTSPEKLPAAAPAGPLPPAIAQTTDDEDGPANGLSGYPASLSRFPVVSSVVEGITAEDVTASSGLDMKMRAYSGLVADFNNDGWPDIFINQHTSAVPLLEMGGPTGFSQAPGSTFTFGDFYSCATADVDGDGALDLFCPTGRRRGTFLGADEFRLDVGDTGGTVATQAYGLLDASGRGRSAAFVHLVGDAYPDLFVGEQEMRVDGLSSFNRFYRNVDGTHFEPDPGAGLDSSIGGDCATSADLNGDGNDELLVCASQAGSGLPRGVRLYSFNGSVFADTTAASGIKPMGDIELLASDFNGDGELDLVQLNPKHLRVSLQMPNGTFAQAFDLTLSGAASMAVGDVNGDGLADIYVRGNRSQLMLVNDGDGTSFSSLALPPIRAGSAAQVLAIDYDNNGLTDFLTLNGAYAPGPLQLIAFFPSTP
jgi:FG-GAP-like repeat